MSDLDHCHLFIDKVTMESHLPHIFRCRETGLSPAQMPRYRILLVVKMLDDLLFHECMFDHHLLYDLHIRIKAILIRSSLARCKALETLMQWEAEKRDWDSVRSTVFLVYDIKPYISEEDYRGLCRITDEIRKDTL